MPKVINYTDEQTKYLIDTYTANPNKETVEKLAEEMGKTVKSVIGKLSREKVYVKPEYTTKLGSKPETKIEIVSAITKALNTDAKLEGLTKCPKQDLLKLREIIEYHVDKSA